MLIHQVARLRKPHEFFRDPEVASRFWSAMKAANPSALSSTLMFNHLHSLSRSDSLEESRSRTSLLIRAQSKALGFGEGQWEPVPLGEVVPEDPQRIQRAIRYIALNANRKGYVTDPLQWPWSTLRDAVGLKVDRWVDPEVVRREIRYRSSKEFVRWFYSYVCADVTVRGPCPFPLPAEQARIAGFYSLREIALATMSTLDSPESALWKRSSARDLFAQLALEEGWKAPQIAEALGLSRQAIHKIAKKDPHGLKVAQQCLVEPRLRWFPNSAGLFTKWQS